MFSRPDFHDAVSDITALLAEHAPAPADPDDDVQARMRQIRAAITAQPRQPGRRRSWWPGRPQRRHRRAIITCVAVPALLGATAAGWAIAVSPPASYVTNDVLCYSGPYNRGPMLDHSNSVFSTVSDGAPPTQVCAREWAIGAVTGDPRSHLIPPLVACVLPALHPGAAGNTGSVGVFPDTTCAKLNLAALPPGYDRAARRLFALDSHLGAGAQRCMSLAATDQFVRAALRRYGYPTWRITHPWGTGSAELARSGCWEGQPDSSVHVIQVLPEPGFTPRQDVGPENVVRTTLSVPKGACREGNRPENGAATIARLQAALRKAGDGTWKVTLHGKTSQDAPCYEQVEFPLGNHSVRLDPVAFPGSGY
jgi:hypothetical protein